MTVEERAPLSRRPGAPGAVEPVDPFDAVAASALSTASASVAARAAVDAAELQALATLAQARRTQALADDPLVDLELVEQCVATEVSLQLRLAPGAARGRVVLAEELLRRRPATFTALSEGRVDLPRARAICDAVRDLPPEPVTAEDAERLGGHTDLASAVEAEALHPGSVPVLADAVAGPAAGVLSPPQLRARLARLVTRADAAGAAARHAAADARRRCTLRPLEDGMALLQVVGSAPLLQAAWQALDGTARQLRWAGGSADEPARTMDQARVDVLLATLLGDSGSLAKLRNVSVELCVVAPAATVLAGAAHASGQPLDPFEEPGLLLGLPGGPFPLPGPMVRELAADARWRKWLVDPCTGHLRGVGSTTYRPGRATARYVRARDGGCGLPTCSQSLASRLDLDHVVPWPSGATSSRNLHDVCRGDHRVKHARHSGGGFSVALATDGTLTWTTPTGTVHPQPPACWSRARDVAPGLAPDDPDPPPF